MEFKEFKQAFQKNFVEKTTDINHLFVVDVDPDEFYNLYLDSFPAGTNEIFRKRREHDCSACRSFIKRFGNVVMIKDNVVESMWKFQVSDPTFQTVINALDTYIKSKSVIDVYVTKDANIGTDKTLEMLDTGDVCEWQHLYLKLPSKFVYTGHDTIDTVKGNYTAIKDVFKRSIDELSIESIDTILELINSNTLYKGEEWKGVLGQFKLYKLAYTDVINKDLFAWEKSVEAGPVIGKIRNHSIGTLLIDISNGMDLDQAVRRYESVVAPTNYKRPKAIYTTQMLEDAKKTVEELGYLPSLTRRHATLDDITVNNILFANRDAVKRIVGEGSMFDELQSFIAVDPKKFSKIEEISIDKFITDVLPTAKEIDVLFENRLSSNMVSLIAPAKADSKSMFKWDNPFSWSYIGNITDSVMKQNVKLAGGNVNGVLRFSIQWNDSNVHDRNDLDAHCIEPSGNEIYYGNKQRVHRSSGMLDVDIIQPHKGIPAVENIIWTDISKMPHGVYQMFVHQFSNRGGIEGFKAEVEFNGQIYEFTYNKELKQGENVHVAWITLDSNGFTIEEKLPSQVSTRDIWNLKTNQFIPVSTIMYSPNYWDNQNGIGHKHVFFMLNDCKNTDGAHGFYNEFLKHELELHKRVFEALGTKSSVEYTENQLSGIGMSTTKRNHLVVRVKGTVERVMKVMI